MRGLTAVAIGVSFLMGATSAASADQYTRGYMRSDGTYVAPYYSSSPDSSYNNNWGVRGNYNPYTGQAGTKSQTWNDRTPSYNSRTYGSPGYYGR